MRNPRVLGVSLAISLICPVSLGCGSLAQLVNAFRTLPPALEARGPGTLFTSIDAAAVDALTYAYLQALAAHDTERMRGGTIQRVEGGFSYAEIQVAGPRTPNRIRTVLGQGDAAGAHGPRRKRGPGPRPAA